MKVRRTPTGTKRAVQPKHCGARVRNGQYCRLQAGQNTDHPGVGRCSRHGGNAPGQLRELGAEMAYRGIMDPEATPADMIEIEPHNGLLIAVRSAAGEFFHWQQRLSALARDSEGMEPEEYKEEFNQLLRDLRDSRGTMARLSKMAIDAGLAERQVVLQERMAEIMVRFAQELLANIPLDAHQERLVPKAMETALLALDSGDGVYKVTPRPKVALRNHKIKDVINVSDAA